MKRTAIKIAKIKLILAFTVFFVIPHVYASERAPISINLIIDGSASFSSVKDEATLWVFNRLDEILVNGDRLTVWNAGTQARVIFTGRIEGDAIETVKRSIRELSPSGSNPDFSTALREAAAEQRQNTGLSYTLLISANPSALSSVITDPQGNLLRFSRVEDFSTWRALVVGLNLDNRVRRAASAFFNN
jgi:hypothetical protein